MNKVILIGFLGGNPNIRRFDTGSVVATFTIATNERYKDKDGTIKEKTEWHNIVAWKGLAEIAEKFLKKGQQVVVLGKITTRSYQDQQQNTRYITEIVADEIKIIGKKEHNEHTEQYKQSDNPCEEDLPF